MKKLKVQKKLDKIWKKIKKGWQNAAEPQELKFLIVV